MFQNVGELANTVADYAKRPRLLDQIKNTFIPLAGVRIGRDLSSRANEITTQYVNQAAPLSLPADFARPRSVVWRAARGDRPLRSYNPETFETLPTHGDPLGYMISGADLHIRPFISGTFDLTYYQIPTLDTADDNASNAVLLAHPQLYLYGTLIELYVWTQDRMNREDALSFYNTEMKIINRDEGRSRAATVAAVGR